MATVPKREVDLIKQNSIVYWKNASRDKDDLFVATPTKNGDKVTLRNIRTGGKFTADKYKVGLYFIQPGMTVRRKVVPSPNLNSTQTVTSVQFRNSGFAVFLGLENGDGIPIKEFNKQYEIVED